MNNYYRLSKSPIWNIQKNYYKKLGIETWGKAMVPFVATTNSFVANSYAQTISAYISDIQMNNPNALPVNIVELGVGHGRFSFMLIKALYELYKGYEIMPFRYIMTDIAWVSVDAWSTHEKLKPFIEAGILDFAIFDVVEQKDTNLVLSNNSFEQTIKDKPLVIVANFIFDVLPFDLFKVKNDEIFQCSVAVEMDNGISLDDEPEKVIKNTILKQKYIPITKDYYEDEKLNKLLNYYKKNITDSVVQIPYSSIKTIDYFRVLSKENLWLIGEEASTRLEELDGNSNTGIKEEGSFTVRVNLHAVMQYIKDENNIFLSSDFPDSRFDSYAIISNTNNVDHTMTKNAFINSQVLFGPRSFFRFFVSLSRSKAELSDDGILSLLELSKYDPYIVRRFNNEILNACLKTRGFKKEALKYALIKTWDNYYEIGEDYKYAYFIGRMLKRLDAYSEAILFFNRALEQNKGEDYKTYYWMGMASLDLKNINDAKGYFKMSIKLNNTYLVAIKELEKLE